MSISFKQQNNELFLVYSPESLDIQYVVDKLDNGVEWRISRCFTVQKKHLRWENYDENELFFIIGEVQTQYTLIDSDILGVCHKFYFFNDIKLEKRHFVAYRNISILKKIDEIVEHDVYIGGDITSEILPIETFELLIKKFPKTAELNNYANSSISTILKEFYPSVEQYEKKFQKYLEQRHKTLSAVVSSNTYSVFKENVGIEFNQFYRLQQNLNDLLSRTDSVSELIWQEQICGLLRLLYPKYIAGIREVKIKGVDHHDKRPDFLMVDANGYVDILEIKKPSVQLLTKQSTYRNNYVPVRELAGAIQQIEKYIYCLNAWGENGESSLQKQLEKELPPSITPKIVNPQGILLLGRSNNFNSQQKDDFELIKRQYKHIAEIMTYDDLLSRIDNILKALYQEMEDN